MLPTNVMSFMKKMVTNEAVSGSSTEPADSGNTLSKLRQTLSSSLMNAQDKVTKLTPVRQTVQQQHETIVTPPEEKPEEPAPFPPKPQGKDPGRRAGTCRVCLKSFKPEEFFKMCSECQQKVCEDCASYSKLDENQDESTWSCSICRRRRQSRNQPVLAQESTDSLLEVPVLEALQRRHSDVKIGSGSGGNASGGGLAPPRSPELRRHSDVSPASLKEIEKVAGDRRDELRWERELDWRKKDASPVGSKAASPLAERRPVHEDHRYPQASPQAEGNGKEKEESSMQKGNRGRRKSRIGRQRSYDEEIKNSSSGPFPAVESGLGLPAALPRRASAYDVYAFRQGEGIGSPSNQSSTPAVPQTARRASFRTVAKQDDPPPYEAPALASPETAAVPGLTVEDDRRTRRRGSQLPDIGNIRGLHQGAPQKGPPRVNAESIINSDSVRRQPSCDGESIKIVIDDVDSDSTFATRPGCRKRVVLRRDPGDKAHRTRGFGMRVVGGKAASDGRLFAYIVWTVPGGPAEKAGLQQGDKILEWCGVSLVGRSFEEVSSVMDRTRDVAELLVEHANDLRMCDLLDNPGGISVPPTSRKSSNAESLGLTLDSESEKTSSSPTRRKLPKTPEQIAREKQVSGRVQIQVFYNDERKELSVAVLAADDLSCHDDTGYGSLPEAYAQLRLLPTLSEQHCVKTDVAEPSQNPMWNATLEFSNVPGEDLMDRTIEVTLWDYCTDKDPVFLGECTVDLHKAFLDDRPVWYRLEDPKQLRMGDRSPFTSPRGSLANEIAMRKIRRSDLSLFRSYSDDRESELSSEINLLHPDHAWISGGSRRGSSQSEGYLEPDAVYQLGQDYSRSLPGSRRSSFHSQQGECKDEGPPPQIYVNRGRRRSSVVRQDPEEILRSLKACKGDILSRQMSFSGSEKRNLIAHRRASCQPTSRKDSVFPYPEATTRSSSTSSTSSSPDDDNDNDKSSTEDLVKLGPGQVCPKNHKRMLTCGEVKLGLLMTKGQLEVEVVSARNIIGSTKESPPDTYIKTYLKDNNRSLQKRKTKVVSHNSNPVFRQTLKYSACDVFGRTLMVMLWERQKGFDHNQGLGIAELALDKLQLTQLIIGWYPLFPIQKRDSDSNNSP